MKNHQLHHMMAPKAPQVACFHANPFLSSVSFYPSAQLPNRMRSWKNLGQEAQVAMYLKGRPRVDMEAAETSHATGVKWRVNTGSFTIITLKRHYVLTKIKLAKQKQNEKKTKHLNTPLFYAMKFKKAGLPQPNEETSFNTRSNIWSHLFLTAFKCRNSIIFFLRPRSKP